MAKPKTLPTSVSVDSFIAAVEHPIRKADAAIIRQMMERVTGCPATMWGPSIIGFDSYDYKYESGHSGTSMMVGFSPRKARHSFYFMPGHARYADITARLGKHKLAAGCLYVTKLADIDLAVLEELTLAAITYMRESYGS